MELTFVPPTVLLPPLRAAGRSMHLGWAVRKQPPPPRGAGLLTPADLPAQRRFRSNVQGTSQHLRNSVCDLVADSPSSLSPLPWNLQSLLKKLLFSH